MSISKYVHVVCDVCNEDHDDGGWYVSDAREHARSDGWHHVRGKDICPDCWDCRVTSRD